MRSISGRQQECEGIKNDQVCYYKGCGVIYGEKEPLSDKRRPHGLYPKHPKMSLNEIRVEMEKLMVIPEG